jgi:hypothetical protein
VQAQQVEDHLQDQGGSKTAREVILPLEILLILLCFEMPMCSLNSVQNAF